MLGRTLKHFTIEEKLGEGGMGVVYRARDTKLQRLVALKVLSPGVATDAEKRKRLFQEARAAARISHPAIAQVYDIDEAEGIIFIAMELVEGQTVRQLIQRKELDLLGTMDVAIQVGEGLAKAHEAGIVHRDIKPANVMLTRDGQAKILDFGLAKQMDPAAGSGERQGGQADAVTQAQTQIGTVMGTAAYMSPEQVKGGAVDSRSDLFSLGVMLFEMATAKLPFERGSFMETMQAVAFEETPSIHSIRSNLPPELQRIITRCLRKRPEDRYPNAVTLVQELKQLRRDTESGRSRSLSLGERFAEVVERARHLSGKDYWWLALGIPALGLLFYLAFAGVSASKILFLAIAGLFLYRNLRNRPRRLIGSLVRRVSRIPEVRLISSDAGRVTIIVDRPVAQLYGRINGYVHDCNQKLFFGQPLSVVIRHEVGAEEIHRLLASPNVHYVRDDVPAA